MGRDGLHDGTASVRTDEFVDEEFTTPETTEQAFKFGHRSAFGRYPRLSFEQFYRHDEHPRPYGRSGL